jgi:hypothetical protein
MKLSSEMCVLLLLLLLLLLHRSATDVVLNVLVEHYLDRFHDAEKVVAKPIERAHSLCGGVGVEQREQLATGADKRLAIAAQQIELLGAHDIALAQVFHQQQELAVRDVDDDVVEQRVVGSEQQERVHVAKLALDQRAADAKHDNPALVDAAALRVLHAKQSHQRVAQRAVKERQTLRRLAFRKVIVNQTHRKITQINAASMS